MKAGTDLWKSVVRCWLTESSFENSDRRIIMTATGGGMIRTNRAVLAVCAGALVWGSAAGAQSARTFKARLSPVPIDVTMQATVAGSGSVSGVLAGAKLTITGTYEGLKSPATTVQLGRAHV